MVLKGTEIAKLHILRNHLLLNSKKTKRGREECERVTGKGRRIEKEMMRE